MRNRLRIVLSGACAVLTAGLCFLYAQEVRAEADRERAEALARFGGETVRLIVADEGLEAGDSVERGDVSLRDWAGDLAPAGALLSLDDVVGRTVTVPLAKGAPVTELNFRADDELPEVPAGMIALQVPVTDKLGLPSAVPAGSRLTAFVVGDDGTRAISGEVQVLLSSSSGGALSKGAISVAVMPQDAPAILAASAEGSLRLVLPASDVEGSGAAQPPANVAPEPGAGADGEAS